MSDFSTLNGLLESAARSADGGLRILDRREHSRWLPWSEVRERAQAVAGRLREVGVLPGQRVALVYPTSVGFFDAFRSTRRCASGGSTSTTDERRPCCGRWMPGWC